MSSSNPGNDQITDSVSQINTIVLGSSPSEAMGMLDIAGVEAMGMSMYNAVTTQQNSQIAATAAITSACAKMLASQAPQPEPPKAEKKDMPPFMPLGPEKKNDSSILITEASTLTKEALKMLNESSNLKEQNIEDINKLIATLQACADKSKEKAPAPSTNTNEESSSSSSSTPEGVTPKK